MPEYLTYAEYQEMGGELDEATFNFLAFDAQSFIDWYTFNRLWNETEIPDRVKQLMYFLIKLLATKMSLLTPDMSSADGTGTNAQVTSQSNDGVSVQYNILHADEIYHNSKTEIDEAIKRYLNGVTNSLGRKLLYRGLYPGE